LDIFKFIYSSLPHLHFTLLIAIIEMHIDVPSAQHVPADKGLRVDSAAFGKKRLELISI